MLVMGETELVCVLCSGQFFCFMIFCTLQKVVTEAWCLADEVCTQINVIGVKLNMLYLNFGVYCQLSCLFSQNSNFKVHSSTLFDKPTAQNPQNYLFSQQIRFMLETMLALRNNDMRKIPGYDPEPVERLRKLQRALVRTFLAAVALLFLIQE